ncbi:type 1 glutamine amidotransferase [Actinotalea fermentans]|uniref:GMP synthase n=1 Tax=Actinotalea fermentans TaxID=43671 RepID=A0A511YU74_9CELL|nr:gamma-glutamyl-gamma-aminobutyrate hydrolase family protein [Actinotalea fermentans]GEN78747.1 GMP synthase [Actinotalea fermentans]
MTARPLLVLQHAPWEGPALVARALAARAPGVELVTRSVLDHAAPDLPAPADLAGLVVLGGPMGADDDARHPGLAAERSLLARAVDADLPVLGVCLGMQLLARALGAAVHAGHGTEIGFAPVEVLADDPVLRPLGPAPTVLHWHSDAAELPSGATLLARSTVTPVQAFRAGSALGLQFHLELDAPDLEAWLASPAAGELAPGGASELRAAAAEVFPAVVPGALSGLAAFADAVRDRA